MNLFSSSPRSKPANGESSSDRPCCFALILAMLFTGAAQSQGIGGLENTTPQVLQVSDPESSGGGDIGQGLAVALDEDLLAVGVPREFSELTPAHQVGAVYIFERQAGVWVEVQKLRAPLESAFGGFGTAVGIARGSDSNGPIDFLVIGEPGAMVSAGKLYLFERTAGGVFQLDQEFTGDATGQFGSAVAIDFSVPPNSPEDSPLFFVAAGAPFDRDPDDPGNSQHGLLRIFQRTGGPANWNASHSFYGLPNEQLGSSVALAGPHVVGVAGGLAGLGAGFGGARFYQQANLEPSGVVNYAAEGRLLPDAQAANLGFMSSGATYNVLDLGTAVFGVPTDGALGASAGKALVFDLNLGSDPRVPVAELQPTTLLSGSRFGTAVAISDRSIAVAAPSPGQGANSGFVFLFDQGPTKADWNEVGKITLPQLNGPSCAGGSFTPEDGSAMALQGLTLAVGCPSANLDQTGTFVYSDLEIFEDGFESGDAAAWQ